MSLGYSRQKERWRVSRGSLMTSKKRDRFARDVLGRGKEEERGWNFCDSSARHLLLSLYSPSRISLFFLAFRHHPGIHLDLLALRHTLTLLGGVKKKWKKETWGEKKNIKIKSSHNCKIHRLTPRCCRPVHVMYFALLLHHVNQAVEIRVQDLAVFGIEAALQQAAVLFDLVADTHHA